MLFVIDFDGTLSVRDSVDELLERHADPAWREVERAWQEGEIDAVRCMREQLRMVRADHVTLENFFRAIQLDASFVPFYRHVRDFAKVAVVSDGLDHAIHVALRNAGLSELPVYANRLRFVPQGIEIGYPLLDPACAVGSGVCKCGVARRLAGEAGGPIVLVGDGKSDACLARQADIVFAKDSLARHCERESIAYRRFQTFADILAVVRSWKSGSARTWIRHA